MQFIPSLGLGLAIGLANGISWRFGTKWFLRKRGASKNILALLAIFKLGLLGLVIWILFEKYAIAPAGFLIGFSITIVFILYKGLRWN